MPSDLPKPHLFAIHTFRTTPWRLEAIIKMNLIPNLIRVVDDIDLERQELLNRRITPASIIHKYFPSIPVLVGKLSKYKPSILLFYR